MAESANERPHAWRGWARQANVARLTYRPSQARPSLAVVLQLTLAALPPQAEIDRAFSAYEVYPCPTFIPAFTPRAQMALEPLERVFPQVSSRR